MPRIISVFLFSIWLQLQIIPVLLAQPGTDDIPHIQQLNRELVRLLCSDSDPGRGAQPASPSGVAAAVETRARLLAAVMERNPLQALSMSLPEDPLQRLSAMLPLHCESIERYGEWKGRVTLPAADNLQNGSGERYTVLQVDGASLELSIPQDETPALHSGDPLTVRGFRLGKRLAVGALEKPPVPHCNARPLAYRRSSSFS